ncbi:UNVERIFIED_CONTAM: hypothetical protein Sradi_2649300 [Sesamum radiatum]|uniref:Uncharacterized protein n=1 Tax=Sesamum radiatum TaxID=300843 RepID=A0AAW2S6H8_SESRA
MANLFELLAWPKHNNRLLVGAGRSIGACRRWFGARIRVVAAAFLVDGAGRWIWG